MEQSKFYQIKNITEHEYNLVGCDGSVITRPIQDIDKSASAFTIHDAKDGDVLTTKDAVFIFKHMDVSGLSLCKSHCDVIGNSGLGLGFDFPIQTVHPATEEQRNKLEKAITAAGYKWDDKKKELKKIEQKPTWSEDDEKMFKSIIEVLEVTPSARFVPIKREIMIPWLESLKERMKGE